MNILQPPGWPRPKGYANGISAHGRTIYTAGVIGWDEREMLVSHRLDLQFEQVLKNIVAILAEGGAKPEHVVRMTVYITTAVASISTSADWLTSPLTSTIAIAG